VNPVAKSSKEFDFIHVYYIAVHPVNPFQTSYASKGHPKQSLPLTTTTTAFGSGLLRYKLFPASQAGFYSSASPCRIGSFDEHWVVNEENVRNPAHF